MRYVKFTAQILDKFSRLRNRVRVLNRIHVVALLNIKQYRAKMCDQTLFVFHFGKK